MKDGVLARWNTFDAWPKLIINYLFAAGYLAMKIIWITGIYILLLMSIIYLASHQQYHELFSIIRSVPGGDKSGHLLLMGLLSLLLNTSLRCRAVGVRARQVLLGSVIVSMAVTLEEVSQIFVQYRSFDLVDLLFDYLGIWVFAKIALYVRARRLMLTDLRVQP